MLSGSGFNYQQETIDNIANGPFIEITAEKGVYTAMFAEHSKKLAVAMSTRYIDITTPDHSIIDAASGWADDFINTTDPLRAEGELPKMLNVIKSMKEHGGIDSGFLLNGDITLATKALLAGILCEKAGIQSDPPECVVFSSSSASENFSPKSNAQTLLRMLTNQVLSPTPSRIASEFNDFIKSVHALPADPKFSDYTGAASDFFVAKIDRGEVLLGVSNIFVNNAPINFSPNAYNVVRTQYGEIDLEENPHWKAPKIEIPDLAYVCVILPRADIRKSKPLPTYSHDISLN